MPTTIRTSTSSAAPHAMPASDCLLEFRNIRIVYDNAIEAIRDVSIAVPEGGIVALLGSNGAGKSTLLKAMSGILYTEEGVIENGTIRFRNEDVHHLAPDDLVRLFFHENDQTMVAVVDARVARVTDSQVGLEYHEPQAVPPRHPQQQ